MADERQPNPTGRPPTHRGKVIGWLAAYALLALLVSYASWLLARWALSLIGIELTVWVGLVFLASIFVLLVAFERGRHTRAGRAATQIFALLALVALVWWLYVAAQPRMTEEQVPSVAEPAMREAWPECFEDHMPYRGEFRRGVWHVRGTLPEFTMGGTPEARVRDSDGEILRVFHTQ